MLVAGLFAFSVWGLCLPMNFESVALPWARSVLTEVHLDAVLAVEHLEHHSTSEHFEIWKAVLLSLNEVLGCSILTANSLFVARSDRWMFLLSVLCPRTGDGVSRRMRT